MLKSASLQYDDAGNVYAVTGSGQKLMTQTPAGIAGRFTRPGRLKAIAIGDSFFGLGNYGLTVSSLTQSEGLATATANSHGLFPGAPFCIGNASDDLYNGVHECESVVDANNFTFRVSRAAAASAAGSIRFVSQIRIHDRNPIAYASAASGQRFYQYLNTGINGQTTAEVLARLDRDALQYAPDIVFVCAGINDHFTDVPEGDTCDNLRAIWERIANAGATPVAFTNGPIDSAYSSYSVARGLACLRVNSFIRRFAADNPWLLVIDAHAVYSDPLDATADFRSGGSSDNLHPSPVIVQTLGEAISAALQPLLAPQPFLVGSVYDCYGSDSSIRQINDHALMQGTSGATAGSVTGNVATGYTLTETGGGSLVASIQSRADGIGSSQRVVVTASADDDRFAFTKTTSLHSRVSAGDVIETEVHIVGTDLTAFKQMSVTLTFTVDGTAYTVSALNTGSGAMWASDFDLRFRTPPVRMPGAPSALNVSVAPRFSGAGGGTFDIGRWGVVKR